VAVHRTNNFNCDNENKEKIRHLAGFFIY